jgi:hypothetical protein
MTGMGVGCRASKALWASRSLADAYEHIYSICLQSRQKKLQNMPVEGKRIGGTKTIAQE